MPVRLVDRFDIAYGATAKSSRLIHGGLRYLEYGDISLVQESLAGDSTLRSFILLLEEPTWPPVATLSVARSGYGDWAADLRALGRHISAEKLTEEPGVRIAMNGTVSPALDMSAASNLSGWYLLRARNYDEAVALARRGPHLRYGSILVRQVE